VTTVVLCGCNFRTAIRATVYEASARDFRIVVATDGVSGASEEALCELGRMGVYLMTADSCLTWLSGAADSHAAA
jgi:nicotinamidase-related amidase